MSTVIQHYTHTDSLGYGGEAFERGTPVIRKADDADKWVICPSHKPFLAAIGDPITVAVGSGIIMENVANYVGSPGNNDYLKVGGSGNFTAGTATDGCVRVMRGGSKAAGDTIRVISL
jgi:hypothetical protein